MHGKMPPCPIFLHGADLTFPYITMRGVRRLILYGVHVFELRGWCRTDAEFIVWVLGKGGGGGLPKKTLWPRVLKYLFHKKFFRKTN
jgi:hypothetical protein